MRWRNRGPAYYPGGSTSAAAGVTAGCTPHPALQASTRIRYPRPPASADRRRPLKPNRFHRSASCAANHRRDRHRHEPLAESEHHFASWTTLAPKNKISGGRLLSSRTPPSANRVAAFCVAVHSAARPPLPASQIKHLRRCRRNMDRSSAHNVRTFLRFPASEIQDISVGVDCYFWPRSDSAITVRPMISRWISDVPS